MKYKELLKKVADFGHGVFTVTMLEDPKERQNFKMWLRRNSDLFFQFKGTHGDIKILGLNKKGMKKFDGQDSLSSAECFFSYLDMALINSFMLEENYFTRYSNLPHETIKIKDRVIGLFSFRWGLCRNLEAVDLVLGIHPLPKIGSKEIYTPKSLKNIRPSLL